MMSYPDLCVIQGDCLEVLDVLPPAKMIFADPPDNIDLKYDNGVPDKQDPVFYASRLGEWIEWCIKASVVSWISVNRIHQHTVWDENNSGRYFPAEFRMFPWYFTFGQHRETDCGNNYRPIFSIASKDFQWHTDRIRIPSERNRLFDKRANPKGRVPGDVWGGPADIKGFCRVQGKRGGDSCIDSISTFFQHLQSGLSSQRVGCNHHPTFAPEIVGLMTVERRLFQIEVLCSTKNRQHKAESQ